MWTGLANREAGQYEVASTAIAGVLDRRQCRVHDRGVVVVDRVDQRVQPALLALHRIRGDGAGELQIAGGRPVFTVSA
jgi:hypothetical protein